MPLLEISHLRKTFDDFVAVEDVSLHVNAGEIFGLVGPNGAGKTTTIRMLSGLLHPDAGQIRINGQPFNASNWQDRAQLGVVPQELAVYPDLTALENLRFFAQLYGVHGAEMRRRIGQVLDATALVEHADGLVKTFSGGMKRRLNFGVAMLHKPKLLILDEPTVGVDPQSRSHLLDSVTKLGSDVGVIYTSHYMEEVESLCDRIAIMDHGKILACGTQHDLLGDDQTLHFRIGSVTPHLSEALRGLAEVEPPSNGEISVTLRTDRAELEGKVRRIMDALTQFQGRLLSISTDETSLERLFLKLTGRRLRD